MLHLIQKVALKTDFVDFTALQPQKRMSTSLFEQHGYCFVPKGTWFYRMGEPKPHGAFFALHPLWANNFQGGGSRTINVWCVEQEFEVLFAVKWLNPFGKPQTALIDIYNELTGDENEQDDLDVKWRKPKVRDSLLAALRSRSVFGWLSTQENSHPLEVFLTPELVANLQLQDTLVKRKATAQNTLRNLKLRPSERFNTISWKNISLHLEFLEERWHESKKKEEDFGLLQKLFLEPDKP